MTDIAYPFALLGTKVTRAAADIFNGGTVALLTASGGRVLLTHIEVEVTAANMDGTASTTRLVSNPTVGTDVDLCATVDINANVIGTIYSPAGPIATAMQAGLGHVIGLSHKGYVIPEGTVDIISSADAGTGGALGKVEAWYIPLDVGATLVST